MRFRGSAHAGGPWESRPSWPASRWAAEGRTRWEHLDSGRVSLPAGGFCWLAALYAESGGYSGSFRSALVQPFAYRRSVWLLAGMLVAVNAWVMDRYLADHTVAERRLPRWLRVVRAVGAAVPVLGLYAVPIWRRLLARQPAWLQARPCRRQPAQVQLDLRRQARTGPGLAAGLDRLRRRARQSAALLALFIAFCQLGPALLAMSWLAESASPPAPSRLPLLATTSSLRLLAAVSTFLHARREIRRLQLFGARARLLLATSAFMLLPFPFSLAAIPAWIPLASASREQITLVHAAHSHRPESDRLRGVLGSARRESGSGPALRRALRLAAAERIPDLGRAEQHRRAFYRLKTLLLFFDAAALGWAMSRFSSLGPILLRQPFAAIALAYLAPCGLGLLIGSAGLLSRVQGASGPAGRRWRAPYGRFLAIGQSTFVAGLVSGALLAAGATCTLGLLLSAVAMVDLLALCGFWIAASTAGMPGTSTPVAVAWMVLLATAAGVGRLLCAGEAAARPVSCLLRWALGSTPLWSLGLALGMGGSLLRPASPWQVVSGRLAAGTRTVPALMALTAALPLGGLAIPLWIYARQRWWPEYERRWGSLAA